MNFRKLCLAYCLAVLVCRTIAAGETPLVPNPSHSEVPDTAEISASPR